MRSTRAIIDLGQLRANIAAIRRYVTANQGFTAPKICLAVKADAYGHGIEAVAGAARDEGVEYLAVATVDEGLAVRTEGIDGSTKILLYSLPHPREFPEIIAHDITPMVCDIEFADRLARAVADSSRTKALPVHLKVDTGMGRIGCAPEALPHLIESVVSRRELRLEGISTHFAAADEDMEFTRLQLERFEQAMAQVRAKQPELVDHIEVHASNSAGLAIAGAGFTMVRPGIAAYGYPPTALPDLQPVMQLRSELVFIKRVGPGTSISYGRTHITKNETHIGTVPIGYGDGYFRALSNQAWVAVGGEQYPVVGRVCMDQLMIDLGPTLKARRYDEVVLFDGEGVAPTAAQLADLAGTISYEITCAISKRVPRVYVGREE